VPCGLPLIRLAFFLTRSPPSGASRTSGVSLERWDVARSGAGAASAGSLPPRSAQAGPEARLRWSGLAVAVGGGDRAAEIPEESAGEDSVVELAA